MNVSDNSSVSEVDECVIYKSAINRTRMKDGEVGVFDTQGVEIGVRVSASVQSHAIDWVTLLTTSLDSHTIPD